jgi:hypothetical protein
MSSVFPEWLQSLPMQQQSVLLLAARGPDGVRKHAPSKRIVTAYRAFVLKAAYFGRSLRSSEGGGNEFMSRQRFDDDAIWEVDVTDFFAGIDELQHHYIMHLIHGTEILGYKHPDIVVRRKWLSFYMQAVIDLHLQPESEAELDSRLGDWQRQYWEK